MLGLSCLPFGLSLWPADSPAGQLVTDRLGISFRGLARLEELHPTDIELSKLLLLGRCVTNDPMRLAESCIDERYVCPKMHCRLSTLLSWIWATTSDLEKRVK
jgi:hypothetical protein